MKDKIVPRKLESHILKFLERKEIIGIRGPRQAGKTTLLKSIMNKIEGDKVLIDMYFSDLREEFERRPLEFIKRFKKDGRLYLFLDEIQKCENAGESLKVIYDNFPDIKIFISGSSSLEIKTNILPHLVGRIFLYELLTFDFYEFILYKDDSLAKILQEKQNSFRNFLEGKDELEEPSFISEFNRYLNEYLIFGGYPEVVKASTQEEKIQILRNIYITWLEKDIVNFFNILETSSFENLVRYLSSKLGNIISISSISSDLRISYKKVLRYIEALKNSYIIGILKPFYKNLVTEIKKAFKIYFLDLGLRNSVLNNF
ncbi:MAG: ATP-binding protein, partial [Candidatus Aenigmatarchaeota archaeon]